MAGSGARGTKHFVPLAPLPTHALEPGHMASTFCEFTSICKVRGESVCLTLRLPIRIYIHINVQDPNTRSSPEYCRAAQCWSVGGGIGPVPIIF